jgi:hypothetical protein
MEIASSEKRLTRILSKTAAPGPAQRSANESKFLANHGSFRPLTSHNKKQLVLFSDLCLPDLCLHGAGHFSYHWSSVRQDHTLRRTITGCYHT